MDEFKFFEDDLPTPETFEPELLQWRVRIIYNIFTALFKKTQNKRHDMSIICIHIYISLIIGCRHTGVEELTNMNPSVLPLNSKAKWYFQIYIQF